jgi:phage I-like protein
MIYYGRQDSLKPPTEESAMDEKRRSTIHGLAHQLAEETAVRASAVDERKVEALLLQLYEQRRARVPKAEVPDGR